MSIRVVIVDDHPVVRDGLRFAIARASDEIDVVGEAGNGRELLDLAGEAHADVYIVDVTMPVINGLDATRELLRRNPSARVIMLSLHDSEAVVEASLHAGARGFVTKETATRNVVEAIREVHRGGYFLSPDVASCLVKLVRQGDCCPRQPPGTKPLTPRERTILQLIGEGHCTKEIASRLALSTGTVHKHRTNLMAKLGAHDAAALVRPALREGVAKL